MEKMGEGVHCVKKDFRVALCGYYGYKNLGDELLAESLATLLETEGIQRREMIVLTNDPERTAADIRTPAVDRNNPVAVWKALGRSETFLLGGGGLFQDSTSVRSCVYYWGTVRMALKAGCVPWAFGQSVGPLARRLSGLVAFDALQRCRVRFVRDDHSLEWLARRGLEARKAPDPVFALSGAGASRRGGNILLNIRPWGNGLPARVAEAVGEYAQRSGKPVIGAALSPEDEKCMTDVEEKGIIRFREIRRIMSSRDVSAAWSEVSAAFGMRLHFCVLSVMSGLRCVAVPYDPKVTSFANDWHLPLWNGSGPLPAPETDCTDLPEKLAATREDLAAAMHAALEKVSPGGTHEA